MALVPLRVPAAEETLVGVEIAADAHSACGLRGGHICRSTGPADRTTSASARYALVVEVVTGPMPSTQHCLVRRDGTS